MAHSVRSHSSVVVTLVTPWLGFAGSISVTLVLHVLHVLHVQWLLSSMGWINDDGVCRSSDSESFPSDFLDVGGSWVDLTSSSS
jgi:hypothetical protein